MKAVSLRNVDDFEQRALWQSVKFPFKLSERMRIIDFTQKGGYKMYKIDALQFGHRGIAGMVQEEDRPPIYAPIRGGAGSIKSSDEHKGNGELFVDSAASRMATEYLFGAGHWSPFLKTKGNEEGNGWLFGAGRRRRRMQDAECSLIAFDWFGQHFTTEHRVDKGGRNGDGFMDSVRFRNDVSFLSEYAVRSGFVRYGATAFFDAEHRVIAIETSFDGALCRAPRNVDDDALRTVSSGICIRARGAL